VAKVTSKLQVTVPKAIADQYRIKPGDEITWAPSGESIRVSTRRPLHAALAAASRLHLFDEATKRQKTRNETVTAAATKKGGRGWRREDLYDRGRPR
jgi:bifunctional DNA-binding transcriptional regulator/antitoxin component of YhaV-PrlF toxin-antitoxin module